MLNFFGRAGKGVFYQMEGTADSSNSAAAPSGRIWMMRAAPRALSIGASIPTR